jgi:hypothetical protein
MGILLAALAGAGDSGVESINQNIKQDNAKDLEAQRVDLETQKAKALEDYKNTATVNLANQQRDALTARLAPTDSQIQAIVARNANNASDYTTDEDKTNEAYQPNTKQMMELRIQNAVKSGDFDAAEKLTKQMDSGKVTAGYGSTVIDQNDIDETTGRPRVLIDNTTGAQAIKQQFADAANTKADAAEAALKSKDPLLVSQGLVAKEARVELDRIRADVSGMSPKDRAAQQPRVDAAQAAYDSAVAKVIARQNAVADKSGTSPAADASAPAASADTPILSRVQSAPPADKYVVGKTYRDAKGNTATYAGNGKWK